MTEPPQPPPDPQYPEYPPQGPQQQYDQPSGQQYGPPPSQQPTRPASLSLGARVRTRPDARFGPSLAGVGAALVVVGGLIWSVGYFAHGFGIDFDFDGPGAPTTHGEGRRFLGAAVFLVLALAGYALVVLRRRGPLATAGTVAAAAGVPLAIGFATLDIGSTFSHGDFPINIDATAIVSIVVWLISYFLIPGARGRAVFLALAAITFPAYIVFKVADEAAFRTFASFLNGDNGGGGTSSHTGTVAVLGLLFGIAYYAIAWLLDRSGRAGAAVGLLYPALATTIGGLVAASDTLKQVGTGVALVVIGTGVSIYGGRFARRFTTWVGAIGIGAGVVVVVTKIDTDKYWLIGILLIVLGLAAAAAGQATSHSLNEPPAEPEEIPAG